MCLAVTAELRKNPQWLPSSTPPIHSLQFTRSSCTWSVIQPTKPWWKPGKTAAPLPCSTREPQVLGTTLETLLAWSRTWVFKTSTVISLCIWESNYWIKGKTQESEAPSSTVSRAASFISCCCGSTWMYIYIHTPWLMRDYFLARRKQFPDCNLKFKEK